MQIEHKLQVGVVALLLTMIAVAGPANSQGVTGIEDCDETNTVPTPPDFTTCLDDAGVDPGVDPSCADPDPTACIPEDTLPCAPGPELVGCVLVATGLFTCEDLAVPGECEPAVDPVTTLGETVCTTLDAASEEADAAACLAAALDEAVCTATQAAEATDAAACVQEAAGGAADTVLGQLGAVTDAVASVLAVDVTLTAPAGPFHRGVPLVLSGTASSAISELPVIELACALTLVSKPSGSTAVAPAVTACGDEVTIDPFTPDRLGEYVFNLTVTYEQGLPGSGSSEVAFTVVNRAPISQGGADRVVSKNTLITLNGIGNDPDSDSLTKTWAYVDAVDGFDASTDPNSFVDLNSVNDGQAQFISPNVVANVILTFRLTVTDGNGGMATDDIAVTVVPGASGGSSGGEGAVDQVEAVVEVVSDLDSFTPGVNLVDTSYTVKVSHLNGVDELISGSTEKNVNNTKVVATLLTPAGNSVISFSGVPVDTKLAVEHIANTLRTFTFPIDFPTKLVSGTYTFTVFYDLDGDGVLDTEETQVDSDEFTVVNVAPTLAFESGSALVNTQVYNTIITQSNATSIDLDDVNWGAYGVGTVNELQSLSFALVGGGSLPTGLVLEGRQGTDPFAAVGTISLASLAGGPVNYDLRIRYTGADLVVLQPRTIDVVATVADQHGLTDAETLFSLELLPSNYGFSIVSDDTVNGLPGVTLSNASPGNTATSNADPFRVTISGTVDAKSLTLAVPDFTSGTSTLAMNGATVKAYVNSVGGTPVLSATVTANSATLDFEAAEQLGAVESGDTVLITIEKQIFGGQAAGTYSGTVTVTGTPVDA